MYTGQMDLVIDDDTLDNNMPVMCANIEVLRSRNISVPQGSVVLFIINDAPRYFRTVSGNF